jgi:phosphoglucosamine mutase
MTVFPQKLMAVDVTDKPDLDTLDAVQLAIQEVTGRLGENGRVLVRYSGTQPVCRIMVEGPEDRVTEAGCRRIAEAVRQAIGS